MAQENDVIVEDYDDNAIVAVPSHEVDQLIKTAEQRVQVIQRLKVAALRMTNKSDWVDMGGKPEDIYFLNTAADRKAVDKIKNGELALAGLKAGGQAQPDLDTSPPPNIFTLYEQNVGMLTPMIAEELREAEKFYPEGWIEEAIKEATKQGIHKWSYISAILERWAKEGKKDGTYRGDSKTGEDKYAKQRYGHIFKR